jgi:hypothetical protein
MLNVWEMDILALRVVQESGLPFTSGIVINVYLMLITFLQGIGCPVSKTLSGKGGNDVEKRHIK